MVLKIDALQNFGCSSVRNMENGFDFLEVLDTDVSCKILTCLDNPADIVRAGSVSRWWRYFVITNDICKTLCLQLFPQLFGIARVIDISTTREKHADVGCSSSVEWQHLKEHRVFTSLARGLTSTKVGECLSDAVCASSTDNYPEEGVRNTLEVRDRIGRNASYWSSSGQSNSDVPERLTYQLLSDFCVITEINVRPFQAYFQPNSPIYSAKAVRFRMGYSTLLYDCEEVSGQETPGTEEKFVWTYTSQEFPMIQENSLQNFKLPQPILCIGGYLQIELLGRVQRQEMDGLFYTCISHVQVVGRSLSPVFMVEKLEPSGRFVLLYNPHAEFLSPPRIGEKKDKITAPGEMVQEHVRGWEQILHMLHGTLGVDAEEEHYVTDEEEGAEEFAA